MKIKLEEAKKPNAWKKWALAFGFLFLVSYSFMVLGYNNPLSPEVTEDSVCSKIRGTPAWVQDNEIIGYGYGFPEQHAKQSFNDVVNDYLIPNEISFVYDLKCPYCQNQIKSFGDSWEDYKNSGLAIECDIL